MLTLLDLTLPNAAENLALEEALLDDAECGIGPGSVLRLWEPATPCVVIGRSSRVERRGASRGVSRARDSHLAAV